METPNDTNRTRQHRHGGDAHQPRKISLSAAVAALIRNIAQGKGDCQDADALIFALSSGPAEEVALQLAMLAGQHGFSWEIQS